jgi:putative tryptophan/tyrosine transport system substrate-binding protein
MARATGISLLTTAPEAKRLGILHQLVPNAGVIGVLIDPNYQQAEDQSREVREAAKNLDCKLKLLTPEKMKSWNRR